MTNRYLLAAIIFVNLFSSCENTPSEPEIEKSLEILWTHKYDLIDAPSAIPLIIDNSLLVYTGSIGLEMIEISKGEFIWRSETNETRALNSVVILSDNDRIITSEWQQFGVWDKETGKMLLNRGPEEGIVLFDRGRNTVTENGYAMVGDTLDLYVLDKSGDINYQIDIPFATNGVGYADGQLFLGQFKTVTGALTLGRITCYNSQTGDSLWAYHTENGGFNRVAPIVEKGILYAGALGNSPLNEVVALEAETGDLIWRYESDYIYTRNAALGPLHYYVNTGGSLAALDKQTGELKWREEWLGTATTKPVYLGGYVYHTNYSELMVIEDSSGKVIHREQVHDGTYFWHVTASSDKIFVQTSRQLIAYQPWHLREE